ncbi:replication initiation protein [Cellulophaga sp. BC115SP]|uniref:replication initiation protein n=1 Tax=Cellulophaga sp. BC115SP TaxID=2683263 RepID=UPI0014125D1C|nr:replication initiation protein [Cellulophaga sp. BC115SP]NBB31236.1 RepB family plasmid replication initiator protein [Cellulophaga sp. BC115SP]
MKKIEINIESIEEKYLEHPYTPNRKDNYLPNQMVISNTQFTRVEQRLFEYFINQINYNTININHGVSVKIPITTVRETIKPEQILAVTKSMAQKVMTFFDLSNANHIEYEHIPLFSSISYNKNNSGMLEFRSNAQLSPYLASLGSQYTRYDFQTILEFKSIYSTLMYKLIKLHLGQNRTTFMYSIQELRKLLQVDVSKYNNLNDFKRKVLEPAKKELKETSGVPIEFEYENFGNKQRNVTHIQFKVITALELSKIDKQDFLAAVQVNPKGVYEKVEEIIDTKYNFKLNHREKILSSSVLIDKFISLHIEFENGLHANVKNQSAYILACLDLVKKKEPRKK